MLHAQVHISSAGKQRYNMLFTHAAAYAMVHEETALVGTVAAQLQQGVCSELTYCLKTSSPAYG